MTTTSAGKSRRAARASVTERAVAHLEAVEKRLAGVGVSVQELKRTRQLRSLDAATLLARFMVDGMPAPELFRAAAADMVKTARADGQYPGLRVYGEMAHLLWKEESLPAAVRLEQLWNEAIDIHSMALFCTYGLDGQTHVQEAFPPDLSSLHSRVIPLEPSV